MDKVLDGTDNRVDGIDSILAGDVDGAFEMVDAIYWVVDSIDNRVDGIDSDLDGDVDGSTGSGLRLNGHWTLGGSGPFPPPPPPPAQICIFDIRS